MKLLVVAATQAEIAPLLSYFKLANNQFAQSDRFDVLITGVGMTATAFALGKHLSTSYNMVLNLGIAGSFDKDIPLGSLVNITQDTFAELGAEDNENFLTINQLGFGENTFYAKSDVKINLPSVSAITVNKVHGNEKSINRIKTLFNPQCESMEGAAVLFACTQQNLKCLQIRSISNYVEKRNKDNWKIGLAIKNLNDWAIALLSKH